MDQPSKPQRPSKAEVASYAAGMLASLRRLSQDSGLTLLAHLVDLACVEAMRNTHADPSGEDPDPVRLDKDPPESRSH